MKMLRKTAEAAVSLKLEILKKIDQLSDILQFLVLITIIDEFCYVKLTNKKDLMRSIIVRRNNGC